MEVPSDTRTPECSPALVVSKHGGTVGTKGEIEQVFVQIGIRNGAQDTDVAFGLSCIEWRT